MRYNELIKKIFEREAEVLITIKVLHKIITAIDDETVKKELFLKLNLSDLLKANIAVDLFTELDKSNGYLLIDLVARFYIILSSEKFCYYFSCLFAYKKLDVSFLNTLKIQEEKINQIKEIIDFFGKYSDEYLADLEALNLCAHIECNDNIFVIFIGLLCRNKIKVYKNILLNVSVDNLDIDIILNGCFNALRGSIYKDYCTLSDLCKLMHIFEAAITPAEIVIKKFEFLYKELWWNKVEFGGGIGALALAYFLPAVEVIAFPVPVALISYWVGQDLYRRFSTKSGEQISMAARVIARYSKAFNDSANLNRAINELTLLRQKINTDLATLNNDVEQFRLEYVRDFNQIVTLQAFSLLDFFRLECYEKYIIPQKIPTLETFVVPNSRSASHISFFEGNVSRQPQLSLPATQETKPSEKKKILKEISEPGREAWKDLRSQIKKLLYDQELKSFILEQDGYQANYLENLEKNPDLHFENDNDELPTKGSMEAYKKVLSYFQNYAIQLAEAKRKKPTLEPEVGPSADLVMKHTSPKQKRNETSTLNLKILGDIEITKLIFNQDSLKEYLNKQPYAFKDRKDADGNTLLHLAAQYLLVDSVRILLDKRADPGALNNDRCTSLHMVFLKPRAAKENSKVIEVLKLLLDEKFNKDKSQCLNQQDKQGKTVLHSAVLQDDSILSYFSRLTLDPNIKDKQNKTALRILIEAILEGEKDINSLKTLLEFGNVILEETDEELVKSLKDKNPRAVRIDDTLKENQKRLRRAKMLLYAIQTLKIKKIEITVQEWVRAIIDSYLVKFLMTLDECTNAKNQTIGSHDRELAEKIANEIASEVESGSLKTSLDSSTVVEIFQSKIDFLLQIYKKRLTSVKDDNNNFGAFEYKLQFFRETFKATFNSFFGIYNGLAFGNVTLAKEKLDKLTAFTEIFAELSTVIQLVSKELGETSGAVFTAMRMALTIWKNMDDTKQQKKAYLFVSVFAKNVQDGIADQMLLTNVVDRITYRYFNQVMQLNEKGMHLLIQVMIMKIAGYFKGGKNLDKSGTIEEHCLKALFTEKNENYDRKQIAREHTSKLNKKIIWCAGGVLSNCGIKRQNFELYEISLKGGLWTTRLSLAECYGYFHVTENEFHEFESKYHITKASAEDPFKDHDHTLKQLLERCQRVEMNEEDENIDMHRSSYCRQQ